MDTTNVMSTCAEHICGNLNTTNGTDYENFTIRTDIPVDNDSPSVGKIIVCIILLLITLITIIGNVFVLISPYVNKRLRNTFTYLIMNLAVTDMLVAVTAMSFYTFDVLLGYWPFGEVMCGVWIFFDYGMTFASVFTLVVISLDRYWSVQWSLHYRLHNTTKKCLLFITIVWLAVLAIWLAPCIIDRVRWSQPNICKWEPSKNREFVIFIALIGHHTPCLVMLFCYAKVYHIMKKRSTRIEPAADTLNNQSNKTSETSTYNKLSIIKDDGISSFVTPSTSNRNATTTSTSLDVKDHNTNVQIKIKKEERDKKAFKILSYILLSYLVCWVPFHVVFDISAIKPDLVPEVLYTVTFWMTYVNSTLNPFVYAFTSSQFRQAFAKIIRCRIRRE